jgi:hypothetical protein
MPDAVDDGPPFGWGRTGNVIELPQPEETKLASLFSAAAGPAQSGELEGETEAIEDFRRVSAPWSTPRRRIWRQPAIVVVAGTLGVVASSTGLAAAAGARNPAARVVAGLVHQLGFASSDVPAADPSKTLTTGNSAAGSNGLHGGSGSVASGRVRSTHCAPHRSLVGLSSSGHAPGTANGVCAPSTGVDGAQATTHHSLVAQGESPKSV